MSRGTWLYRCFFVTVGLVFIGSLLGILLTGPIVVRVPRFDMGVDPSSERLRRSVKKLCSEFTPRSYRDVQNLDRAAAWIAGQFRESELDVEIQEYEIETAVYRNVIARRAGSDPSAGAIVIGAHYDAYGDTPGANDNASGVAVLLELARTLPDVQTVRTHYLVAFSTEEPPIFGTDNMGSYVFARQLRDSGVDVTLMVALDLVGFYSDEPGSQRFPSVVFRLLYPGRGNFIAVIGDLGAGPGIERAKRGMRAGGKLPVHSLRAPSSTGFVHLSDHWSFRRLGLSGVLVTDTAFLRYPHYHEPEDTPEKLDYERMAELVKSLHGILWERD